jgi:hypothetical protein
VLGAQRKRRSEGSRDAGTGRAPHANDAASFRLPSQTVCHAVGSHSAPRISCRIRRHELTSKGDSIHQTGNAAPKKERSLYAPLPDNLPTAKEFSRIFRGF